MPAVPVIPDGGSRRQLFCLTHTTKRRLWLLDGFDALRMALGNENSLPYLDLGGMTLVAGGFLQGMPV